MSMSNLIFIRLGQATLGTAIGLTLVYVMDRAEKGFRGRYGRAALHGRGLKLVK